jgi:hypothetical protein
MKYFLAGALAFYAAASAFAQQYEDYTVKERAGLIGLNFLFGAGSYASGHIWDGMMLTTLEACGIALVASPFIIGADTDNPAVTAALVGGSIFLVADAIFSIIYPLVYEKPRPATARLQDLRNWTLTCFIQADGTLRGQIAYTFSL